METKNRVLIVGSGGREHAFAWKISQSEKVEKIFVAPGNAGTENEIKTTNIDISPIDIDSLIKFSKNEFKFDPESFEGNHLMKTVALNMFLESNDYACMITGIRWDEQDARKDETAFSPRQDPDHMRIHPILHFDERDIWEAHFKMKVPYCNLYEKGYRSLGAAGTTTKTSDLPAWKQDLESTTERSGRKQDKENLMEKLRDLGYM